MDWFDLFTNCDCLGCVRDALASGQITQDDYDEYFDQIESMRKQTQGVCPNCGNTHAYISEYEPSMMHCGVCGVYSERPEFSDGPWTPWLQGASHSEGR